MAGDDVIPFASEFIRRNAFKLWPKIYAYGLALVCDPHGAEDLCQETFVRLFSMKRPVDVSRPLLPLLLTILRNLAATASRIPKAVPLEGEGSVGDALAASSGKGPWQKAALNEERSAVQRALDQLSADWRSVLYLRDGLGFSYREIAEVVERSEDNVRVTLHRARKKVRDLLKEHHKDERRAQ